MALKILAFFIFADSLGRKLNENIIFPDNRSACGLFVVLGEKMQGLPIVRQIIVEAMRPIVGFYERTKNKSTATATIVRYNCQPVLELGMPKTSFCANSGTIMSLNFIEFE